MSWFWPKKDPAENDKKRRAAEIDAAEKAAWLKSIEGKSDEDRINECIKRMPPQLNVYCAIQIKDENKRIPSMKEYLIDYAKNPRSNMGQADFYISWLTSIEKKTYEDRINKCIEDMQPRVVSYCRADIQRQNESIPDAEAAVAAAAASAAASAAPSKTNPLFSFKTGGNRKRKSTRKVQRKKARKTRRN
jgi:CMP-2-keto-3-deoxyoctulosonic acid synthetase